MIGVLLTKDTGKIVGPVAWLLGHVMNGIFNVLNTIGIPNIGLAIRVEFYSNTKEEIDTLIAGIRRVSQMF